MTARFEAEKISLIRDVANHDQTFVLDKQTQKQPEKTSEY